MKFTFIYKRKKFVIFAFIKCTVENIRDKTIHIILKINTCHNRNYIAKIYII